MFEQKPSTVFRGVAVISIAVAITAALLALVLNQRCQSQFKDTLIVYPGAELVSEAYPFLAQQRVELYSVDTPEVVSEWYASQRAAAMRERVVSGDFSELPPENWIISPAVGRSGSTIVLAEVCP
ncbi:MAG: hypothetical protein IAE80_17520 [Anaerolinea sp.]|nr:hypothetical protein [Anaerolinea sp.]